METHWFGQETGRVRMAWGREGVQRAGRQGNVVVIVDVLCFSTSVVTAVAQGGSVQPCQNAAVAEIASKIFGGEVAVRREEVPEKGRFSLSPVSYIGLEPGTRVCLPSPNGATCCAYVPPACPLLIGALVNADTVATAVNALLADSVRNVTLVACGERWETTSPDGDLRFAIEDYLGAGAILAGIDAPKSPEARVCEAAFRGMEAHLVETIWECGSGIELRERGYGADVQHASRHNLYDVVPHRSGNTLKRWTRETTRQ